MRTLLVLINVKGLLDVKGLVFELGLASEWVRVLVIGCIMSKRVVTQNYMQQMLGRCWQSLSICMVFCQKCRTVLAHCKSICGLCHSTKLLFCWSGTINAAGAFRRCCGADWCSCTTSLDLCFTLPVSCEHMFCFVLFLNHSQWCDTYHQASALYYCTYKIGPLHVPLTLCGVGLDCYFFTFWGPNRGLNESWPSWRALGIWLGRPALITTLGGKKRFSLCSFTGFTANL